MKILIVGGGVAGPALARFLKGFAEVTLIDKAPAWGNIGYAIGLWSNGQVILEKLGIAQHVFKNGHDIPWSSFENYRGEILKAFSFGNFNPNYPTKTVTRTSLQQALVDGIDKYTNIKLHTTLKSISQTGDLATVTFSDDTTETFDLVVGADGIHSEVRSLVFGENFIKSYGWDVYVFWASSKFETPKGAIDFSTSGKICFVSPLEDKSTVMLGTVNQKPKEQKVQDFLKTEFVEFNEYVRDLINTIEDPEHIYKGTLSYVEMKDWYKGRVVLIGDAKHARSPVTGMGASMALEDAFVLGEELKSNKNISEALQAFAKRRDKRIHKFVTASRIIENLTMSKSSSFVWFRDIVIEFLPTRYFIAPLQKILSGKI